MCCRFNIYAENGANGKCNFSLLAANGKPKQKKACFSCSANDKQ